MTKFLQLCLSGTALGARYALVALGFVIIYKSSGILNFAQGEFLLLGAYVFLAAVSSAHVPIGWGLLLSFVFSAALGLALERVVLRPLIGEPVISVIMITIGLLLIINEIVPTVWGFDTLNLGDPWGIRTSRAGHVVIAVRDLWTIGLAAAVVAGFFAFFRFSSMGVAMRATALDQEAALAQGISARRVFALSWGIAGVVAALSGVTLGAGPAALTPSLSFIALAAFPAMILGGLDSPAGAVIGPIMVAVTCPRSPRIRRSPRKFSFSASALARAFPRASSARATSTRRRSDPRSGTSTNTRRTTVSKPGAMPPSSPGSSFGD